REVVVGAELEACCFVVETVGSGEHEDRHAAAGGDDALRDFVTGRAGDVSVEDGDVVGVEPQQLQSGLAVACDVGGDRFQAQAVADGFRHKRLVLDDQHAQAPMVEPRHIAGIPKNSQSAVRIGQSHIQAGPNQHAAPIASVAKVMTAYLVLRGHPLGVGDDGPTITLTDADVADTDRRGRQRESVVPIVAGEQLTERQALQALLLPSANNIAPVLARWDSGSAARFVAHMNATARLLGMTRTRYTDPRRYDDA